MMICSLDVDKLQSVAYFFKTRNEKYRFEAILTKVSHASHLLESLQVVMTSRGPPGWIRDVGRQRKLEAVVYKLNDEAWPEHYATNHRVEVNTVEAI